MIKEGKHKCVILICLKIGNKGKETMGKENVSFTYVWK